MSNKNDTLINRYVYDVTRRLPEKEREDVKKELESSIYDMLPENPGQKDIENILYELGAPSLLAEKYRQKPRYLISPALFDNYIRALKWILPLCGIVFFIIGVIRASDLAKTDFELSASSWVNFSVIIIFAGISEGISGVLQGLCYTTLGFGIADHIGNKANPNKTWKIENLPECPAHEKNAIPLSDSILELIFPIVFYIFAICLCLGLVPIVFSIQNANSTVSAFFSTSFLMSCIFVFIISIVLELITGIVKIIYRRWFPLVCGIKIGCTLLGMITTLYLVNRDNIFHNDFIAFLQSSREWGDFDLLRFLANGDPRPAIIISCIIVIVTLTECGVVIYKMDKSRFQRK